MAIYLRLMAADVYADFSSLLSTRRGDRAHCSNSNLHIKYFIVIWWYLCNSVF